MGNAALQCYLFEDGYKFLPSDLTSQSSLDVHSLMLCVCMCPCKLIETRTTQRGINVCPCTQQVTAFTKPVCQTLHFLPYEQRQQHRLSVLLFVLYISPLGLENLLGRVGWDLIAVCSMEEAASKATAFRGTWLLAGHALQGTSCWRCGVTCSSPSWRALMSALWHQDFGSKASFW